MTILQDFKMHRFGPLAATKPHQIIILFHGLGSDGADLISLAPIWSKALPNALFISPDAPFPCDMAPYGHQWFSLQEWTEEAMLKGVEAVFPLVDNFVDKLLKTSGLTDADMAMVGFSQGAMTAMYVAQRRKNACAGVLAYSGALLGSRTLKEPFIHKLPTCVIHGDADSVVPVTAWHQAMTAMKDADFPVEGQILPGLAHGIDDRALALGQAFLKKILPQ